MNEKDFFERRRYRRVKVNIPVKYRVVLPDKISKISGPANPSQCVDISRGGMQILTEKPCSAGDENLIETEFIMSGRTIKIISHIVWAKFDEAIKKYRSGVEFIVIKSGDLEVIGQIA